MLRLDSRTSYQALFTMIGLQDFHEPVQALEHALKHGAAKICCTRFTQAD